MGVRKYSELAFTHLPVRWAEEYIPIEVQEWIVL